jgi:hypothetical protein
MQHTRIARFHVDPDDTEKMLTARGELIAAIRRRGPGLIQASLGRVDERTWLDVWRWQSRVDLDRALEAGPMIAEGPVVFALTQDLTTEDVSLVDER